jgi:hypothetical protein
VRLESAKGREDNLDTMLRQIGQVRAPLSARSAPAHLVCELMLFPRRLIFYHQSNLAAIRTFFLN